MQLDVMQTIYACKNVIANVHCSSHPHPLKQLT